MIKPEVEPTPEHDQLITEADFRTGLLISVAIQAYVESDDQLYSPLPDDLKQVAKQQGLILDADTDDPTAPIGKYVDDDEELCKWIERDSDDNYVLTSAATQQMSSVYANLGSNPIAWRTLDSVILNTLPE